MILHVKEEIFIKGVKNVYLPKTKDYEGKILLLAGSAFVCATTVNAQTSERKISYRGKRWPSDYHGELNCMV